MNLPHFSRRIANKTADYRSGGPILIVAFGDSVTMGATAGGSLIPDDVYHQRLKRMLEQRYPSAVFSVINAGIGGECISHGTARLDRDVLRHQPDLVIIGFGLNDVTANRDGHAEFQEKLAAMVARIRRESPADIILLTPNFMNTHPETHCADLSLAEHFAEYSSRFSAIQSGGYLARFAEAIRNVGLQHGIPVADVYREWQRLSLAGINTTDMLANRLNHPVASAHQIAADAIFQLIAAPANHSTAV